MFILLFLATAVSDRMLYFHSLAAVTENSVPLRILDNSTAWQNNPDYEPRSFVVIIIIIEYKIIDKSIINLNFFLSI